MSPHIGSFVVISPAKDEQAYIERTIESMLLQTLRPFKWVIVDDGSRDRTPTIIEHYSAMYTWIIPRYIRRDAARRPGSAEIQAFYVGYEMVRDDQYEFLVKLDADLELPPDYFARLLSRFEQHEKLGIASGGLVEKTEGSPRPVKMPSYHAVGASKVIRRQCFMDIGGFPLSPGWDTADEIKATALGWKTRHFPEIEFYHLRPEGAAIGFWRTNLEQGEMYYAYGGGPLFLLLKCGRRLVVGKPAVLGAIALLCGYLRAATSERPRLVTKYEAACYRKMLNERVMEGFSRATQP